jgi:hypothetical protein
MAKVSSPNSRSGLAKKKSERKKKYPLEPF